MSLALDAIVARLIHQLVRDGLLTLEPGASVDAVVDEVLLAMARRTRPAQFGAFLADVLVRSALVDELYADDPTLSRMLSEV